MCQCCVCVCARAHVCNDCTSSAFQKPSVQTDTLLCLIVAHARLGVCPPQCKNTCCEANILLNVLERCSEDHSSFRRADCLLVKKKKNRTELLLLLNRYCQLRCCHRGPGPSAHTPSYSVNLWTFIKDHNVPKLYITLTQEKKKKLADVCSLVIQSLKWKRILKESFWEF